MEDLTFVGVHLKLDYNKVPQILKIWGTFSFLKHKRENLRLSKYKTTEFLEV